MTSSECHGLNASAQGCVDRPLCWICHEEGPDKAGELPVRSCSCRGDSAGFAHAACLKSYAHFKIDKWNGEDLRKFIQPWTKCPHCCQYYQNELALHMVNEFVHATATQYPGDKLLQVAALDEKLRVLVTLLLSQRLLPVQKEEANKVAHDPISLIEETRGKNSKLTKRIIESESIAYNGLGIIALREGTEESVKAAVGYFEKYCNISKSIGHARGVAAAEANIALAKSKYEGSSEASKEEILKKRRELYEQRVLELGENHHATIATGLNLARDLLNDRQIFKAKSFLTKLYPTSKRVLGPDHIQTKYIEQLLRHEHS